jgi:hypothetical protein
MNRGMSANGPKRTSLVALHMSALGGKADMTLRRVCPLWAKSRHTDWECKRELRAGTRRFVADSKNQAGLK